MRPITRRMRKRAGYLPEALRLIMRIALYLFRRASFLRRLHAGKESEGSVEDIGTNENLTGPSLAGQDGTESRLVSCNCRRES